MKRKMTMVLVTVIALMLPAQAAAHVTVSPAEAPAEGYAMLDFTVPHGCEAAPTTKVMVQMPDQVISAVPEEVAGWKVRTKEGKLPKPAEQHGETVTEGVREISWTGGPLPSNHLQRFGISVAFAGEAGDSATFKAIQECAGGGETAWIQEVTAENPEPDHPAPTVELTSAEGGHGDEAEPASAEASDEGGSGNGLAIAALVIAVIGMLAGGAALIRTRG